ncbi:MAG TPA: hypothetical protein VHS30_25385, partial [Streptosporangiaceae bacterium]|nr:hypothetical protein [Streptosporangiaceae bacterium]
QPADHEAVPVLASASRFAKRERAGTAPGGTAATAGVPGDAASSGAGPQCRVCGVTRVAEDQAPQARSMAR